MPQITLYLDEPTVKLMREQAQAAGIPYSRWVADLIRQSVITRWPAEVLSSFGAFPEMPLAESLRVADSPDLARESW
jgi:hypothetical protein